MTSKLKVPTAPPLNRGAQSGNALPQGGTFAEAEGTMRAQNADLLAARLAELSRQLAAKHAQVNEALDSTTGDGLD